MSEGNGNGKLLVPFMGGNIVIKEGGSFKNDKGEQVNFDPCIDVSSIVDSKKRVNPAVFKNMIEAVSKHPEAMKAVTALA
ncbi:hypothetical protein V7O62_09900 [Methanolobus sp. ZRKC2]|uniref:hypothetical protein n=1 Tax=Methanolobus sp. ZRKC2 TaxID=3125783 RepID=UPI003247334E